jgi:hypothetical protein
MKPYCMNRKVSRKFCLSQRGGVDSLDLQSHKSYNPQQVNAIQRQTIHPQFLFLFFHTEHVNTKNYPQSLSHTVIDNF